MAADLIPEISLALTQSSYPSSLALPSTPALPPSPPHPAGLTGAELREAQASEISAEDTEIAATRAAITASYQDLLGMCVACAADGLPHDHDLKDCQSTPAEDVREWQRTFKPPEGYICVRCWLPLLDEQFHVNSIQGSMAVRTCCHPRVLPTLGRKLITSIEFQLSLLKGPSYLGPRFMVPWGGEEHQKKWLFTPYGSKESFVQANLLLYYVLKRHDLL